jgi:hypothetical protein
MTVLEARHLDENGSCIWEKQHLPNILHQQGEEFILKTIFNTSAGIIIPGAFYLGLDNRTNLTLTDTLSEVVNEPTNNGYMRQGISSSNGFQVTLNNLDWLVTSSSIMFNATGGSWGPVKNIFLTNVSYGSGFLISSVPLKTSRTIESGQTLSLRIALGLRNSTVS